MKKNRLDTNAIKYLGLKNSLIDERVPIDFQLLLIRFIYYYN